VNTAARRFPSITNEDAIRPHQNAFQRWSSPDAMIPDAAPTERADTMALHHPPTFKVYTPDEVRSVPFRKSMPAYEELRDQDSDGIGARTLLKWTGIGIVGGLAVLTTLVVLLNFGADRAFASNLRSALMGSKTVEPAVTKPAAPPVPVVEARPTPKLELPATKPAAPKAAPARAPRPTTYKR
jgi:hypothetical protein